MGNYLEMKQINKQFVGIPVLKNVDLSIRKGEIHALVGENGSGKSTLMKILFGLYKADSGTILLDGRKVEINCPKDAYNTGIQMIHQELNLVPELTVGQNILLGNEITKGKLLVDYKAIQKEVQRFIDSYNLGIKATSRVKDLGVAQRQMVEILKSLYFKTNIVVMDEPTAALTDKESKILFEASRKLRALGTALIYISHRLEELIGFADRVTILRDGVVTGTANMSEISQDSIVSLMVGRTINQYFIKNTVPQDETLLEVENLNVKGLVSDINFKLRKGEVLGIAGLMGARRTEIAKAIFGLIPKNTGIVKFKGKEITIKNAKNAIDNGIGYLPEDRKEEGLVLVQPVYKNVTYPKLRSFTKFGIINEKKRKGDVRDIMHKTRLKEHLFGMEANNLSGGNQQKIIMGRWFSTDSEVLILNAPTRGIDIGAKQEVYGMINDYVSTGRGVVFISSEMSELVNMSDRIIVVKDGKIIKEFEDNLINKQEDILTAMMGGLK